MVRAILFDLDNTLFDRQAAFRGYAIDFCRRLPKLNPGAQARAVDELVMVDDWGYRPRDEFCAWVADRFPEAGLRANEIWDDFRRHLPSFVEPDPRIESMLARLSVRFRLLAVTNGSGLVQREKLQRAGLSGYLSETIVSGEVGFEKPHPAIFRRALAAADCPASEALLVGDDPWADIAGAKTAGLRAWWVSLGRRYPAGAVPPDQVLSGVLDVEGRLP